MPQVTLQAYPQIVTGALAEGEIAALTAIGARIINHYQLTC